MENEAFRQGKGLGLSAAIGVSETLVLVGFLARRAFVNVKAFRENPSSHPITGTAIAVLVLSRHFYACRAWLGLSQCAQVLKDFRPNDDPTYRKGNSLRVGFTVSNAIASLACASLTK